MNARDPTASAFEKCKHPAEDVGAVSVYDSVQEKPVLVSRVDRGGILEANYRLFRLPALDDGHTVVQFECIDKGTKIPGVKWRRLAGTGPEHDLDVPFRTWLKQLVAGERAESIVHPDEEMAAKKAANIGKGMINSSSV